MDDRRTSPRHHANSDREKVTLFLDGRQLRCSLVDTSSEGFGVRVHDIVDVKIDEDAAIEDVNLRLGFPQLDGFEVVDRLYSPPDDDGSFPKADYPEVQRIKSGAVANIKVGSIAPGTSRQVFTQSLRLAVGPAMKGKKVGIKYSLTAKNKKSTEHGLLKIKFDRVSSGAN